MTLLTIVIIVVLFLVIGTYGNSMAKNAFDEIKDERIEIAKKEIKAALLSKMRNENPEHYAKFIKRNRGAFWDDFYRRINIEGDNSEYFWYKRFWANFIVTQDIEKLNKLFNTLFKESWN